MTISKFMDFAKLYELTTGHAITQEKTNIVESWEILKNDPDLLLSSVKEAIKNFEAAYDENLLSKASKDKLFKLFLYSEKSREIMETLYLSNEPTISEILENYEKTLNPEDKMIVGFGEKTIEFYKTGKTETGITNIVTHLEGFINSKESDILNL